MTEKEWIEKLKSEGYSDLNVCRNEPNTEFEQHTHDEHTVHVILKGEFTLIEEDGNKVLKEGDRFEIKPGTTHSAKCGDQGCDFIVGVKK